ncbi:MAG: hypothetical protein OES24_22525 [Acidimicrobiia bacterium]|nr:hypothetical protein [Acidimicrobiia bacterium]
MVGIVETIVEGWTDLFVLLILALWCANALLFAFGWAVVRRAAVPSRTEIAVVGVAGGAVAVFCELMWYFFVSLD